MVKWAIGTQFRGCLGWIQVGRLGVSVWSGLLFRVVPRRLWSSPAIGLELGPFEITWGHP